MLDVVFRIVSQISPLSLFHVTPSLTAIVFFYLPLVSAWTRPWNENKYSIVELLCLSKRHALLLYLFLSEQAFTFLSTLCQHTTRKQNRFHHAPIPERLQRAHFLYRPALKTKKKKKEQIMLSQQVSIKERCPTRCRSTLALLSKPGVASKHCCSVVGSVCPVPTVLPECLVFSPGNGCVLCFFLCDALLLPKDGHTPK